MHPRHIDSATSTTGTNEYIGRGAGQDHCPFHKTTGTTATAVVTTTSAAATDDEVFNRQAEFDVDRAVNGHTACDIHARGEHQFRT